MIEFTFDTDFILDNKKQVSAWLLSLANSEGFTVKKLHYNFVSAEKIHSINKQFLNHDNPTDVIEFDYCVYKELSGEVFVCQKIVEQNAVDYSQTIENETLRVLCHALLHLCGHKDNNSKDLAVMRSAEDKAIAAFHSTYK
ncbi:MAG: rRNA maturation RNase YbeY [Burkholderiaceae bacterium]